MLTKNDKWHAVFDEILDEKDNVVAQATFHLNNELIDASKRARLIAAAPDMLAALEAASAAMLTGDGDWSHEETEAYDIIDAAIAKAKGGAK
jgi:hypothetical protein